MAHPQDIKILTLLRGSVFSVFCNISIVDRTICNTKKLHFLEHTVALFIGCYENSQETGSKTHPQSVQFEAWISPAFAHQLEKFRVTFTANSKCQIQVESFSK